MSATITPLFQLNMLIHLSLPYPENSIINPYFFRKGYLIKKIEFPIPLNPHNVKKMNDICNSKKNVTPEIILFNPKSNEYALIECKVQSFKLDWSQHNTRQAAGYLSLTPEYISDLFQGHIKPGIQTKIYYAVASNHEKKLSNTLHVISNEVKKLLGYSLSHEVLGMKNDEQGLHLIEADSTEVKIIDKSTIQNNALLYLIPFDINGKIDEEGKEILKTQIRNVIRILVGKNIGGKPYSFTSNEICERINPVWHQLPIKFQNKVRKIVHKYIVELMEKISSQGIRITHDNQIYTIPTINKKQQKKISNFIFSDMFLNTGHTLFNDVNHQISMDEILFVD